jgi:hypothetical protein
LSTGRFSGAVRCWGRNDANKTGVAKTAGGLGSADLSTLSLAREQSHFELFFLISTFGSPGFFTSTRASDKVDKLIGLGDRHGRVGLLRLGRAPA